MEMTWFIFLVIMPTRALEDLTGIVVSPIYSWMSKNKIHYLLNYYLQLRKVIERKSIAGTVIVFRYGMKFILLVYFHQRTYMEVWLA